MTAVLFQRVDGKSACAPVDVPRSRSRRRLSALVKCHADRFRPFIVSVHRRNHVLSVTDMSVRMRKEWPSTLIGPHDTVIITYLPRGGGSAAGGSNGRQKGATIGLLVATIALAAIGQFWAIPTLLTPALGAGMAGAVWGAASAAVSAGPSLLISRHRKPSMTAVNAFVRGQTAYVFTDGKLYTREGDTLGSSQKVEILAHLPAVLAARGQSRIRSAIAFHCAERFNSFDDMLAGIVDLLQKTREGLGVPPGASVLELTLAGWSHDRGEMELWTVSDSDRPGVPAFTLHEIVANVSPLDDRMMRDAQAAGLDIGNGEPEALGLALLRLQRGRAWPSRTLAAWSRASALSRR